MKKTVRQFRKGDIIYLDGTYYRVIGFKREAVLEVVVGKGSIVGLTSSPISSWSEDGLYEVVDKEEFELIKMKQ